MGHTDLVNVTKGNVVAFFTDLNGDGRVDANELTGLALGNKVSVSIGTDVHGDIVTNYNDKTGALGGDTEAANSATTLLPNLVTSLTVAGDVTGKLMTGGTVSHLSASSGNMHEILTGSAANGIAFDFNNGASGGGNETLAVTVAAGVAGPSLLNATIGSADIIHLGDGGAGAAGGSVSKMTILNDTDGFLIQAGAGGAGAAGKTKGGTGGSLSTIVVNGPSVTAADGTPNSVLQFVAGAGGAGSGSGKGGAGGTAQKIFVDYNSANASDPAPSTLADNVIVQGGAGGNGASSGAGGSLSNIHVLTSTPHDLSLGNPIEFQILAGHGGAASGGKAGKGGSIFNSEIRNVASPSIDPVTNLPDDTTDVSPTKSLALIESGYGGSATGSGTGGGGGSINGLTLKGFGFEILSGVGGSGISRGGAGGSIGGVSILGSVGALSGDDIHVQDLVISTGGGGSATTGKGGAGGAIGVSGTVSVSNADFGDAAQENGGLQINTGQGGTSGKGAGGAGGAIKNITVTDIDFSTVGHPNGNSGAAAIVTGAGGNGTTAGGAGGAMSNVSVVGTRLEAGNVKTGAGGNGGLNAISGKGGAGGAMVNVTVRTSGELVSSATEGGFLYDPSADFSTIHVGDLVADVTNSMTATVTSVDKTNHELFLTQNIFSNGDSYTANALSGTDQGTPERGLLVDTGANFSTVAVGSVVFDTTSYTAAKVVAVDAADHELILDANIITSGDGYLINPVSGTVKNTTDGLLVVDGGTSLSTVAVGAVVTDTTNSQMANVLAVDGTNHELILSAPIFTTGDTYSIATTGPNVTGTAQDSSAIGILQDPAQDFTGVAANDTVYDVNSSMNGTVKFVDAADRVLLLNTPLTAANDVYFIQTANTANGTAGSAAMQSVLVDSTRDFSSVVTGDSVIDLTHSGNATVQFVDAGNHELILKGSSFVPGDQYQIITPAARQGTAHSAGTIGLLLDSNQDFTGVKVGDTVTDNTNSSTATVIVSDPAVHELVLNNNIFMTGDSYTTGTHNGTAQDSGHVLVDLSANFHTAGVTAGDTVENVTTTGFNNGVPVTADVTAVGMHELTLAPNATATFSLGDSYIVDPHGSLGSGVGGLGNLNGAGGAGGSIKLSSVVVPGNAGITAGHGGSGGAAGAAGAGGSMTGAANGDGALSAIGSAFLIAGDAGAAGVKPGAGGSISLANIQAFSDITFMAGNGTAGGAGGSITSSGFSGPYQSDAFVPSSGNIVVQAGTGGVSATKGGGAGGSISGLTGFVSDGSADFSKTFTTRLTAGAGGGGISKGGAGGSVKSVNIFGGGGFNVDFYMDAGDAGNASTAKKGATGGSISNIGVGTETSSDPAFALASSTNFHHLSAGNGGNSASGKGGLGGSVTGVHVNGAIGARTGKDFGFDLGGMGGISAGAGGTGSSSTAHGLAGNVTDISADAIASIVAGHLHQGDALLRANLATLVDGIILNGNDAPAPARYPFTLSYGGQTTAVIPGTASNIDVATALNALSSIQSAGGVGVTNNPSGGFLVLFQGDGMRTTISGTENAAVQVIENAAGDSTHMEVQQVNVLGLGQFTLSYGGQTTAPLAANATPAEVQAALDGLMSGGNAVITDGVTVTQGSASDHYIVTFNDNGSRSLIAGTEMVPLGVTVNNAGSGTSQASETVGFPAQGVLDPAQFASANLVGGIADIHQQNAVAFRFLHNVSASPTFVFGDAPIDGLIAAVTLTANKNFVPEAFVTADASGNAIFQDNLNS